MKRALKTSEKGYRNDSPDKNNPVNLIPSGKISMENVSFPVIGVDNHGNQQMMYPGQNYQFPGSHVMEIPVKEEFRKGGSKGSKKYTSKNIQSSTNELFTRNEEVYGPRGKKIFKPKMDIGGGFQDDFLKKMIDDHSKTLLKKSEESPNLQSVTTDDFVKEKKTQFNAYLLQNTMKNLVSKEQDFLKNNLDALVPKAQMGGDTGQIPPQTYSPFATFGPPNYTPQSDPNFQGQQPVVPNNTPWTYDMNNPNAPTGNQAYGYNPTMVSNSMPASSYVPDSQLQLKSPSTKTTSFSINGEDTANMIITGVNAFSSLLEKGENNRRQNELSKLTNADAIFATKPAGSASRGDYDTNSGMFRPDKMIPIQFQGYNTGRVGSSSYKGGGEYKAGQEVEMSDAEIKQFLAAGGQIKYL